ncbi:hypothetical protein Ahy_B06g083675 [Arachis hypogaea]|uniref:CCHC-type domain-containing protein n=1 Tax=Arachis hypogaea TaxID=3818 RepID=A0A444YQE2_ARAHY|nr:hypothetical protein Ahy_B06g083675 [Arachis hypogaea]
MSDADIGHMINIRKGEISVGQIYRALANQAGGYEHHAKNMYNKIAKQRCQYRCKGLNSIIAKYVNSRYNLVEFIQHFNQCVDHTRWKEVQADLASVNGKPFRQLANIACQDNKIFIFTRKVAMNLLKQFREEDATQKELANDVNSVKTDVQVNASRAGLATNDMGHGIPRDPRICRTKGSAAQFNERKHRCVKCGLEGYNRTTCHVRRDINRLEGNEFDIFEDDLVDQVNIEDDEVVYDENIPYDSNEVVVI